MSLHPSRQFFWVCLAFCAGVFARSFMSIPEQLTLGFFAAASVLALYAAWHRGRILWALLAVSLALGIVRYGDATSTWQYERNAFLAASENSGRVRATIASHERLPNTTRYTLEGVSLSSGDSDQVREGHWQLLQTGDHAFSAGERVTIDGARFDVSATSEPFLKRDGSAGAITFPKSVVSLGSVCASVYHSFSCMRYTLNDALSGIREYFEAHLRSALPEPHASFAIGLLTGGRAGISPDIKDNFRRTGLSHIIAVSGYNITIVIFAVSTLLGIFMLSRRIAFWASTVFLVLFTVLVGAGASVVRSSLMGFLVIFAQKESRMYSARVAIACAAAAMLVQNPLLIRHDLGFALSFLATAGLLALYPRLAERVHNAPKLGGVKDIVLQSLAAQLTVLPLTIVVFGNVPIIFLFANVAVLPFIPPAMLLSFLASVAGMVSDVFGRLVAFPAHAILSYQLGVVRILAGIPYGSVAVASSVVRWMLAILVALCVLILFWRLGRSKQLP